MNLLETRWDKGYTVGVNETSRAYTDIISDLRMRLTGANLRAEFAEYKLQRARFNQRIFLTAIGGLSLWVLYLLAK